MHLVVRTKLSDPLHLNDKKQIRLIPFLHTRGKLSEVLYAILEQNGKITVIQKAEYRVPSAKQLKIKAKETGICHIVIDKGVINKHGLSALGLNKSKLEKILSSKNVTQREVYLMVINDAGEVNLVRQSEAKSYADGGDNN